MSLGLVCVCFYAFFLKSTEHMLTLHASSSAGILVEHDQAAQVCQMWMKSPGADAEIFQTMYKKKAFISFRS